LPVRSCSKTTHPYFYAQIPPPREGANSLVCSSREACTFLAIAPQSAKPAI
jgi:hypothetical protein